MRKTLGFLLLSAGTIVSGGCNKTPDPPPFKPVVDVKLLMEGIVDPSADLIWESSGTIVESTGVVERKPKDDEEWTNVRNRAMMVAEAGNLLMMAPRAKDTGDWMKYSQEMIDTGTAAMRAAEAKDVEKLFATGGQLYQACTDCHQNYIEEIKNANK